jgi:two-component system NarL family response regulator
MTGATSGAVRVLLADDHAVVVEGLVAMIGRQSDMAVVAEAGNGPDAVALWKRHRPDVGLVDLRMPELDGAGVIAEIRRTDPSARVIILTTYDTEEDIYRAVRAGARGYLLKDARRSEVLEAIRRVHRGETVLPSSVTAKLAHRMADESLSQREREVLTLLADGKTNREIGAAIHVEESTVKTHLRSIFTKLHAVSRTDAVTAAMRRGLLRSQETQDIGRKS